MNKAQTETLIALVEKYGEVNLRTISTEMHNVIQEDAETGKHRKAYFNSLNELLATVSEKIFKSNTIKVVYKDLILIIGDDSVVTGRKTRQQVIDSMPETEYRLIDGMLNAVGHIPKKDFTILPQGDESEPSVIDYKEEPDILDDLHDAMEIISGMFTKETYAVRAPMGFGLTSENEKFQIQISLVRDLDWIAEPELITMAQYKKANNIKDDPTDKPIFKAPTGKA